MDVYVGNGCSSTDVALIWQVAPDSSLHIPPTAVVERLPVVEEDAFPPDNDNLTLRDAGCDVKLTGVYTSKEIASCIDRGRNGSSSPDVAVIWQVAPVTCLHIPPVGVVGRLPILE